MRTRRTWITRAVLVVMLLLALTTSVFASNPTDEPGSKMIECPDCGTSTACMVCYGLDPQCESCGGTNVCATCGGTGYVQSPSSFYNTAFSLLPPVIAIALALITKEVYSSLFIGILVGGLLYSNFAFEGTLVHVFSDGIVSVLSDSYNVGILIFLVILGTMVCLMNKAGGSAAFGRWAKKNIKSRVGAQLASIVLGCLIFIDDYFNCLTVGSVMRPITDRHHVSRAKLAYIIDATAAPVCIIAPISSWAAAVSGFAEDGQGLTLFIRAIPYNFYALLTIVMMLGLVLMKVDFGPMAKFERNAIENNDLFSGSNPYAMLDEEIDYTKGTVMDLVLPIAVLELAVQPLMLAGAAYLLLWALDRLFLSPYSWQKKTDVASKTRQGGALCPVGRVALRLLAAAMVVVYLALVLGGLFGRVSGLTVEWLLRLRFLLVIPGAVLYAGMKAPPPAQEEPAD